MRADALLNVLTCVNRVRDRNVSQARPYETTGSGRSCCCGDRRRACGRS
jgi:hypothetical protein